MSIARDGGGGLVFLERVGGVVHVFASQLTGGAFGSPVQLDGGLAAASSQPVLAAGNGGVLLVAFVNAGELYVTQAAGSGAWRAPQGLHASAQNPSIQMSNFGKAYLAFTAAGDGGEDVDVAFYSNGTWANATAPLNVTPGDNAGTGTGRPAAATAGDGIGIVAWGEAGHVYARRISRTSPSVSYERLDPATVGGSTETSADSPAISAGGDSSYPDIVFRETVSSGGNSQTRVLLTRVIAEDTVPAAPIDGLSSSSANSADQPALAMNEYGRGFATASTTSDDQLLATPLITNGGIGGSPFAVDPVASSVAPDAVPALAGLISTLIAYQQATIPGASQIELRYAANGTSLGPPLTVSAAAGGPTQADDGLAAAGDTNGDAAAAWVQGGGGVLSIDTAQLYVPPGQAVPAATLTYTRRTAPVLSWDAARAAWGPILYTVTLDGTPIGTTSSTSLSVPTPLIDGPHVWRVTASNPAGQQSSGPPATVFTDTVAPSVHLALSGRPRAGHRITIHVNAVDAAAAVAGARASGVASVTLGWGDRTPVGTTKALRSARHTYRSAGFYRLSLEATDRAGNATIVTRYLRILP